MLLLPLVEEIEQECRAPEPHRHVSFSFQGPIIYQERQRATFSPPLLLAFLHFEASGHCISLNPPGLGVKGVRNRGLMADGGGGSATGRL